MRVAGARSTLAALIAVGLGPGIARAESPGYDDPRVVAKITNGEPSVGDPAVVALATHDVCQGTREVYCTGTLVAPRVVLTAAHCVSQPVEIVEVFFGDDVDGEGTWLRAAALRSEPSFDPSSYANDIGAVILGEDAPVEPALLADLSPAVGADARIVGFGIPEPGGGEVGLKRSGQTLVSSVDAQTFEIVANPGMTCQIDSGGPVLLRDDQAIERVAGITSNGDPFCEQLAVNTRVDAYLDAFLLPVLDEAASAELSVPPELDPAGCPGCSALGCGEGEVCEAETDSCVPEADDEAPERGCSVRSRGGVGWTSMLVLAVLACRRRRPGNR